jgi:HlyD family secretion protein
MMFIPGGFMSIEAALLGNAWRRRVAPILALSVFVALAMGATAEPAGMAVTVVRSKSACFDDSLKITGFIVAREEALVRPEVDGYHVSKVLVADGDVVTAGQKLLELVKPDGMPAQMPANAVVNATVPGILVSPHPVPIGMPVAARADPLFRIIRDGEFDFVGDVPQTLLNKIKSGQPVRVETLGSIDTSGVVRNLAPDVDYRSQLGHVQVQITGKRNLRAGSYASATIDTGRSCNTSVPLSAVLFSAKGSVVEVVESGRVEVRSVQTGLFTGTDIEIRSGLKTGDLVVRSAGSFLNENDPVRPILVEESESRR